MKRKIKVVLPVLLLCSFILTAVFYFQNYQEIEDAEAATFSVDSTLDTSDANAGDGFCDDGSGNCTFRAAIEEANALGGADTITFAHSAFPATTQTTITVSSQLPTISERLTVTAHTNWDTSYATYAEGRPGVKLTASGTITHGFVISGAADYTRISGLKIEGFDSYAIETNSGADHIQIGLDCLGTLSGTPYKQRNIFVNNGGHLNLYIADHANVSGNWFGLDEDGVTSNPTTGASALLVSGGTNNVIGFEDSDEASFSCTQAQARNVFSGGTHTGYTADSVVFTTASKNKFSGNYLNILPDGSDIIQHDPWFGVYFLVNGNYNWIGTDGDGKSDDLEGNVIAGYAKGGIYGYGNTDGFIGNRISGNIIGGNPAGTADVYTGGEQEWGININGDPSNHVIGYCDDNEDAAVGDADMCSNGGQATPEYQRNYIIGIDDTSTDIGIRLTNHRPLGGVFMVYGNYIGVGTDNSDLGNEIGIKMHKYDDAIASDTFSYIGDTGIRANTIKYNTYGVYAYDDNDNGREIRDWKIQYNTITENDYGVYFKDLERHLIDGVTENSILNNTITNNTYSGITLLGSPAEIKGNTITGNGDYGIYIASVYDSVLSSYSKQTSLGYASDLVPHPLDEIGGSAGGDKNTISGNSDGGVKLLGVALENDANLYNYNTYADNNSNPAIISSWYGAVEVLDGSLSAFSSGVTLITVAPSSGSTSYTGAVYDSGEFGGNSSEGAWGPTGFDYDDETSWWEIINFEYATDGTRTDYGPFSTQVTGTYANDSLPTTFTYDGADNDTNIGGIVNYYQTGSGYRYQVADVVVYQEPDTPSNSAPTSGATDQSITPTLVGSNFSSSGTGTHASSVWKMYTNQADCQAGTNAFYNSGDSTDLISYTVNLEDNQTFWWAVSYKDASGNYTSYSTCTSFTTENIVYGGGAASSGGGGGSVSVQDDEVEEEEEIVEIHGAAEEEVEEVETPEEEKEEEVVIEEEVEQEIMEEELAEEVVVEVEEMIVEEIFVEGIIEEVEPVVIEEVIVEIPEEELVEEEIYFEQAVEVEIGEGYLITQLHGVAAEELSKGKIITIFLFLIGVLVFLIILPKKLV